MKNFRRKHFVVKIVVFYAFVGLLVGFVHVKTANAYVQDNVTEAPCSLVPIDDNGASMTGNGYAYQSFEVGATSNANKMGETAFSSCTLTRSSLAYKGLVPDQVWIGHSSGGWTAAGSQTCLPGTPAPAAEGVSKCTPTNGDFGFAEDDAAAFSINGNLVACNGMSGAGITSGTGFKNLGCVGPDLYDLGISPITSGGTIVTGAVAPHNCPWTGANDNCFNNTGTHFFIPRVGHGFLNLASPWNITGTIGTSEGFLNNINVKMWYRNTYNGGYGAVVALTFRYPQRDSQCKSAPNVTLSAGAATTYSFTFKNTGLEPWRTSWSDSTDPRGTFKLVKTSGAAAWMPAIIALPSSPINHDATATFTVSFTAPTPPPSTYTFDYRMEDTGFGQFGATCSFTFTVNPAVPPTASCSGSFTPTSVEPGGQLSFTFTITNTSSVDLPGPLVVNVLRPNPPGGNVAGYPKTSVVPTVPGGSTYTYPTASFTATDLGRYVVVVSYGGISPTGCANAATSTLVGNTALKPYVRLYGADIAAGNQTCPAWGANAPGDVLGFRGYTDSTLTTPDVSQGAGGQLGIFSLGKIDNGPSTTGFSSAVIRNSIPVFPRQAQPPLDLDFANTGAGTPGSFTSGQWCTHDYYSDNVITTSQPMSSGLDIGSLSNGSHYHNGSLIIGPSSIPTGTPAKKIIVYVNGNVTLTGDITYAGSASWSSPNQIPSLTIIAKGDINIAKDVTQLDGSYISQCHTGGGVCASGGNLYTCTTNSGAQISDTSSAPNKFTDCNKQLVVNGSVTAVTIKWQRTYGSAKDGAAPNPPNEDPRSATRSDCSNNPAGANTHTCAAEVVDYGPEVYAVPGSLGLSVDYAALLPPIF